MSHGLDLVDPSSKTNAVLARSPYATLSVLR